MAHLAADAHVTTNAELILAILHPASVQLDSPTPDADCNALAELSSLLLVTDHILLSDFIANLEALPMSQEPSQP